MSGRGLAAARGVGRCEPNDRRGTGLAARCKMLVALLAVGLLLGVASVADATSSFYWYGENNSTCWQTGQPGSGSQTCDLVGGGFLTVPGRLFNTTGNTSASGDYCAYYGIGDNLNTADSNQISSYTGFEPPSPVGNYQEWDAHGNVCQASGTGFGQRVTAAVPGNKCNSGTTCGMHHYVSFAEQGYNDQPWSKMFGSPSLIISAEADVQTLAGSNPAGWGYLCPLFQDMAPPHNILEYCLQEWRGPGNAKPDWEDEGIGTCAEGPDDNNYDTVQTYFYPGTSFATERAGSSNTGVASAGWKFYTAAISEADLQNAIALDKKPYKQKAGARESNPEIGYGCGRAAELSGSASSYALIGVEQGVEGWSFSEIGASGAYLQLRTEYTSLPPVASTGAASGVLEEQATLNGSVNPNNAETKYHFEYGPTIAYGKSTPEASAGAGTGSVGVSAPITGLAEGTTYHFRIVATNADGTVNGSDQTFTTPFIRTTPVALREASTGYSWVYYTGKEHAVWEWTWNGSTWFNSKPGGFVLTGSNPAAVRAQSSGDAWDYYVGGGDDAIWQGAWNGKEETQNRVGGEVELNTSPSVLREEGTGYTWVNYVNKKEKEIWEWTWNGSSWFNSKPGGFVAPGTSPVAVREAATGHQWIYYVGGGDDELWVAYWNGKEWTQAHIGGEVAENSSPAVVREEGTGYTWVDYVKKSDKSIREWTYNGSSWGESEQGSTAAANTSPVVSRETGTGYQWVYYVGSEGAIKEWTWNGSSWISSSPGGSVASGTSPAMVQPASASQWVYYQGSEDPISELSFTATTGWKGLALSSATEAPAVSTGEASGVQEEQATVSGTVKPNDSDTHYYFQYGLTTGYGGTAPASPGTDVGVGSGNIGASTTITGLEQESTYHYRLAATNAYGTTYGSDHTFKTTFIHTTPVALREASSGDQWVYYTGKEHAVWEWTWNGSSWFNSKPGGFVAAGSNPAAVRATSSGDAWDYYVGGGDSAIWQGAWNGKEETQNRVGGEVEGNTSPSVVRDESTGDTWVNYVKKTEREIWEWTWNGSSWSLSKPGGFVETGTTPVSIREHATGHQWIYYVGGGDDELWVAYWNGKEWTQTHIGGEVAENSSPAVVREEGTGYTWVDYVKKSDKSIREWTYNGSSWGESEQGGTAAANTSPVVSRETGTGYQWLFYVGSEGAIKQWTWNGSTWVSSSPGGSAEPGTSPAS
jgi:hypothetical protein